MDLEDALPHVDQCLGCLACEPACPSGVQYRDLISPFRALAAREREMSWGEKMRRRLISETLPYPERFRVGAVMGRWVKPFVGMMPKALRPMMDLLPEVLPKRVKLEEFYPAQGAKRGGRVLSSPTTDPLCQIGHVLFWSFIYCIVFLGLRGAAPGSVPRVRIKTWLCAQLQHGTLV